MYVKCSCFRCLLWRSEKVLISHTLVLVSPFVDFTIFFYRNPAGFSSFSWSKHSLRNSPDRSIVAVQYSVSIRTPSSLGISIIHASVHILLGPFITHAWADGGWDTKRGRVWNRWIWRHYSLTSLYCDIYNKCERMQYLSSSHRIFRE